MAVGPGEREGADEAGAAVDVRPLFGEQAFDLAHRQIPVAARIALEPLAFGPIGGVDPRPAAERRDLEPAVVGERGQPRRRRARMRLQQRVVTKTCPRLLRSEEHTSELQSLMRNSYAVFCLKKKRICEAIDE